MLNRVARRAARECLVAWRVSCPLGAAGGTLHGGGWLRRVTSYMRPPGHGA
jgi:hypothetical protein